MPAQMCIFEGPLWMVQTRLWGNLGLRAVESSLQWSWWKMGTPAWRASGGWREPGVAGAGQGFSRECGPQCAGHPEACGLCSAGRSWAEV